MQFPGARALTAVMSEEQLTGATICPVLHLHFIYAIEHIVNSAHSSSLINYPGVDTHSDFFNLKVFITYAGVNNGCAAVKTC